MPEIEILMNHLRQMPDIAAALATCTANQANVERRLTELERVVSDLSTAGLTHQLAEVRRVQDDLQNKQEKISQQVDTLRLRWATISGVGALSGGGAVALWELLQQALKNSGG